MSQFLASDFDIKCPNFWPQILILSQLGCPNYTIMHVVRTPKLLECNPHSTLHSIIIFGVQSLCHSKIIFGVAFFTVPKNNMRAVSNPEFLFSKLTMIRRACCINIKLIERPGLFGHSWTVGQMLPPSGSSLLRLNVISPFSFPNAHFYTVLIYMFLTLL